MAQFTDVFKVTFGPVGGAVSTVLATTLYAGASGPANVGAPWAVTPEGANVVIPEGEIIAIEYVGYASLELGPTGVIQIRVDDQTGQLGGGTQPAPTSPANPAPTG